MHSCHENASGEKIITLTRIRSKYQTHALKVVRFVSRSEGIVGLTGTLTSYQPNAARRVKPMMRGANTCLSVQS